MKNSKWFKIILGAIALFFVWHFMLKNNQFSIEQSMSHDEDQDTMIEESHEHRTDSSKIEPSNKTQPDQPKVESPQTTAITFAAKNEFEKGQWEMSSIVQKAFQERNKSEVLMKELTRLELEPQMAIDTNPYTGEMKIVRTKGSIKGTRYLHAQYFTDENGQEFLQHLSYEIPGGEGAFQRQIELIQARYNLSKPIRSNKDFIQWNLNENMEIWIKVLSAEDLGNDTLNAYTKDDIGTIRVAIEKKIHEDGAHDHD